MLHQLLKWLICGRQLNDWRLLQCGIAKYEPEAGLDGSLSLTAPGLAGGSLIYGVALTCIAEG